MSSRLLKIRINRFETGRPLARQIYLNLPRNHKMVCVGTPGEELKSSLLEKLPLEGVRELYAKPMLHDAGRNNPDTFPIHIDPENLEAIRALGKLEESQRERALEEALASQERERRRAREAALEPVYRSEPAPGPEKTRVPARAELELDPHLRFDSGEAKEDTDPFFPREAVRALRELDRPVPAPRDPAEDDSGPLPYSGPSYRALTLIQAVREIAMVGEQSRLPQLKEIAGILSESARVFANVAYAPDADEHAMKALKVLREMRGELRRLALPLTFAESMRIDRALVNAIRAFRELEKKD